MASPPVQKPLIKRPKNARFRTVLSIDGGGLRGIIPTMVLITLEKEIKNHIFFHRDTLIPELERSRIHSVDDFDVDLTDYFNFVAGTSIGSVIATYISSRGMGWNPTRCQLKRLKNYDTRPGSMGLMRGIFRVFGSTMFSPWSFRLRAITSLVMPPYSVNGLESVLRMSYSEEKMSNLETGLLVTSYDLDSNEACSFLRSSGEKPATYLIRTARRVHPRRSLFDGASTIKEPGTYYSDRWREDLEIQEGKDFHLKDITRASAAAPGTFRPAVIRPVNSEKDMHLIDGGAVANNPTLQALTYNPNPPGSRDDLHHSAIFSVGCGVSYPEIRFNPNPGLTWWLQQGYLLTIFLTGSSEYVQQVVDHWLDRDENFQPGQYSRFQIVAENDLERKYLSSLDNASYLKPLEVLGAKLAKESLEDIKHFVKNFIFATDVED